MDYLTLPGPLQPARQSFADIYNFSNEIGDKDFANNILSFAQPLVQRDQTMQGVYDIYNGLGSFLQGLQQDRGDVYEKLNNDTLGRLAQGFQTVNNLYGPQGTETARINNYYGNYAQKIAADNARKRLFNSGIANKYGLSQNYIDNTNSKQALADQEQLFKTFAEQDQRLSGINKLFVDFLNQYNQNIKGTQDDYLKQFADTSQAQLAQLGQGLTNSLLAQEEARLNMARARSGGGAGTVTPATATTVKYTPEQLQKDAGASLALKTAATNLMK